jgi:hypothetical protein
MDHTFCRGSSDARSALLTERRKADEARKNRTAGKRMVENNDLSRDSATNSPQITYPLPGFRPDGTLSAVQQQRVRFQLGNTACIPASSVITRRAGRSWHQQLRRVDRAGRKYVIRQHSTRNHTSRFVIRFCGFKVRLGTLKTCHRPRDFSA